jgi:hypothetical protein
MRGSAMTRAVTMTRRWLVWFPVLMVGSLLYWTVALGLGGMSLMAMSALSAGQEGVGFGGGGLGLSSSGEVDTAPATPPRDGYEPIIVRLEESAEPEDVDDNPGCGLAPGAFPAGEADVTPAPGVSHGASPLVVSY